MDACIRRAAKDGRFRAVRYDGFWAPMDTLKERFDARGGPLPDWGRSPWALWRDQPNPGGAPIIPVDMPASRPRGTDEPPRPCHEPQQRASSSPPTTRRQVLARGLNTLLRGRRARRARRRSSSPTRARTRTAEVARARGVRVIETQRPRQGARPAPRRRAPRRPSRASTSDADVDLTAESVRVLVDTLARPGVLATSPVPRYDLSDVAALGPARAQGARAADERTGGGWRVRASTASTRPATRAWRRSRTSSPTTASCTAASPPGERVVSAGATSVVRPTTSVRREPAPPRARPAGQPAARRLWGSRARRAGCASGALVDLLRTRRRRPGRRGLLPRLLVAADRVAGPVAAGSAGPRSPGAPTSRAGVAPAARARLTAVDTRLITHRGFAARSDARSGTAMDVWGLPDWHDDQRAPCSWPPRARRHERDLSPADVRRLLLDDPSELAEVLPTFAAAVVDPVRRRPAWPPTTSASGTSSTAQRDGAGGRLDLEPRLRARARAPGWTSRRWPCRARWAGSSASARCSTASRKLATRRHRDAGGRRARPRRRTPRRPCTVAAWTSTTPSAPPPTCCGPT